jgi:hypothetical protein
MQIEIAKLNSVTNLLFDHLKELGIDTIEIDNDFYWNIPKSQLYDPYNEPKELDLGQLSDDWNDLQKVISGNMDVVSYNFIDLAAILKAIGEKVVI